MPCRRLLKFFTLLSVILLSKGIVEVFRNDAGYSSRDCRLTLMGLEYSSNQDFYPIEDHLEPCMFWEDVVPKPKTLGVELEENFCRNPGDFNEPYCFSMNTAVTGKQPCHVPLCPELSQYRMSSKGVEFQGKMDVHFDGLCLTRCKPRGNLGISCLTHVNPIYGKPSIRHVRFIPCDIPMYHEILTYNSMDHTRKMNFVSTTTWYVPVNENNVTLSGSGEMMLKLPELNKASSQPYTVEFRIRLADPLDVRTFHLNIFFLLDDTFVDYYNLSFSMKGTQMERVTYSRQEKEKLHKPKEMNETIEIKKRVEHSRVFKKFPFLRLGYEWIPFVLKFYGTRVALFYKGDERIPALQMLSNFLVVGAQETFGISSNKKFPIPRFVSFRSQSGTSMVTIEKVNDEFYSCIEGRVKYPESGEGSQFVHPQGVMPLLLSKDESPVHHEENKERQLCIQLMNTPAVVLFTSSPIYNSRDLSLLYLVLSLHIDISTENITITRCGMTRAIDDYMNIECEPYTKWNAEVHLERSIPSGTVISLRFKNYLIQGKSIVKVWGSIGTFKSFSFSVPHPVYLRYWTVLKRPPKNAESLLSQRGPLDFFIFSDGICKEKNYDNYLMSSCLDNYSSCFLTGEAQCEVKRDYSDFRNDLVSWSTSGKSCISWSSFPIISRKALVRENKILVRNYCAYLPRDAPDFKEPKPPQVDVENCTTTWSVLRAENRWVRPYYWIGILKNDTLFVDQYYDHYCLDALSLKKYSGECILTRKSFLEDFIKVKVWVNACTNEDIFPEAKKIICHYKRVLEFAEGCSTFRDLLPYLTFVRNVYVQQSDFWITESETKLIYCKIPPEEMSDDFVEEKKEETVETDGFWCYVSLDGDKESCQIPRCKSLDGVVVIEN